MGMLEHIALVSQTNRVPLDKLAVVAAALQKQVSRDFKPYWKTEATVSAFATLRDVPLGYWQIIIRDDIPHPAAGIHLNQANGQPFALVRHSTNWSLTTSHELLEMLADPYGRNVAAGDSVKPGQGRVEYLVEVCDPSEAASFGYTVNGVLVSDFYTAHYFDPLPAPGVRYSFAGAISRPREVLVGGYISWYDPMSRHVFQLKVHTGGEKEFVDLGAMPGGFSAMRLMADRASSKFRAQYMEEADVPKVAMLLTAAATPVEGSLTDKSTGAQADALQEQIDALITA
jgi:hypothetical protein